MHDDLLRDSLTSELMKTNSLNMESEKKNTNEEHYDLIVSTRQPYL